MELMFFAATCAPGGGLCDLCVQQSLVSFNRQIFGPHHPPAKKGFGFDIQPTISWMVEEFTQMCFSHVSQCSQFLKQFYPRIHREKINSAAHKLIRGKDPPPEDAVQGNLVRRRVGVAPQAGAARWRLRKKHRKRQGPQTTKNAWVYIYIHSQE